MLQCFQQSTGTVRPAVEVTTVDVLFCCHQLGLTVVISKYNKKYNRFTALCPWLPGWAGTRRNTHPPTILIIIQPLSVSSIYYASSLFKLRAWQSFFCTTSIHAFFGLPLGLKPSTSWCIHFFTQSVSSFCNTQIYCKGVIKWWICPIRPSWQNCPRYPIVQLQLKLPGESDLVPLTQLPLFLHRGDVTSVPFSTYSHASSTFRPHSDNPSAKQQHV